jgi:hypothetical protein
MQKAWLLDDNSCFRHHFALVQRKFCFRFTCPLVGDPLPFVLLFFSCGHQLSAVSGKRVGHDIRLCSELVWDLGA